ncbi:sensor histidine kinase [Egicoccus halophilus]|uniref:histidine kinase n=1 Tax=Egicoccus halophilus TaxID=1670830 RepID=A0A8J3ETG0_9ACTN|nr:sensor histidine kinase [Egicoccus halophilus]GGI03853.1 two-component sensor histidine kinase [Egicoccus halophilus]
MVSLPLSRRQWAVDTGIAVVLAGLLVSAVWLNARTADLTAFPPNRWTYVSGALLCLVLVLRRRAPLTTLVVAGIAFTVFRLTNGYDAGASTVALFLALAAAGTYGGAHRDQVRGIAVAGLMALVVWSLFAQRFLLADYSAVFALQAYSVALNVFFFGAGWVLGDQQRVRREREADLAARTAELTARSLELEEERQRTAEKAATEERLRLARELHDVLGHHVSVMGVQAAAARRILPRDPDRATEALAAIEHSSRQAVTGLQRVLELLRTDDRDVGGGLRIGQRLDVLAEELRTAGLSVTVQATELPPLPTEIDLALGRVVQEALTNTLRHAGPGSSAWVRLAATPTAVEVEVIDDAGGEPLLAAARAGSGSGLRGMRERVELHGGRFTCGPTRPRGFRVEAWLPLPEPRNGSEHAASRRAAVAVSEPTPAGLTMEPT